MTKKVAARYWQRSLINCGECGAGWSYWNPETFSISKWRYCSNTYSFLRSQEVSGTRQLWDTDVIGNWIEVATTWLLLCHNNMVTCQITSLNHVMELNIGWVAAALFTIQDSCQAVINSIRPWQWTVELVFGQTRHQGGGHGGCSPFWNVNLKKICYLNFIRYLFMLTNKSNKVRISQ